MLSPLIRVGRKTVFYSPSRSFATNLLKQLSLTQLKNEAKRHGISPSGSKATLITRIEHVESRQNSANSATSIYKRDSSIVNHSNPSQTSPRFTGSTLNVKLPDLSTPQEPPVSHIPFLPDFWDSSRARGAEAIRHDAEAETPMRKVLVIAGTSTQHAGGPTYGESDHIESESESGEDQIVSKAAAPPPGFWTDVTEDIGLPRSFDASAPLTQARDTIVSAFQDDVQQKRKAFQSRPLDPDEARGVWVLLLILGGSWLAGGLFLVDDSKKEKHSSKS